MDASSKIKNKTPKTASSNTTTNNSQLKTFFDQISSSKDSGKNHQQQSSDIKKASKSDSSVKRHSISHSTAAPIVVSVSRSQSSRSDTVTCKKVVRSKSRGEKDKVEVYKPSKKDLVKAGSHPSLLPKKNQVTSGSNQSLLVKEKKKRLKSSDTSSPFSLTLNLNSKGEVEAKHESVQMVKVLEAKANVPWKEPGYQAESFDDGDSDEVKLPESDPEDLTPTNTTCNTHFESNTSKFLADLTCAKTDIDLPELSGNFNDTLDTEQNYQNQCLIENICGIPDQVCLEVKRNGDIIDSTCTTDAGSEIFLTPNSKVNSGQQLDKADIDSPTLHQGTTSKSTSFFSRISSQTSNLTKKVSKLSRKKKRSKKKSGDVAKNPDNKGKDPGCEDTTAREAISNENSQEVEKNPGNRGKDTSGEDTTVFESVNEEKSQINLFSKHQEGNRSEHSIKNSSNEHSSTVDKLGDQETDRNSLHADTKGVTEKSEPESVTVNSVKDTVSSICTEGLMQQEVAHEKVASVDAKSGTSDSNFQKLESNVSGIPKTESSNSNTNEIESRDSGIDKVKLDDSKDQKIESCTKDIHKIESDDSRNHKIESNDLDNIKILLADFDTEERELNSSESQKVESNITNTCKIESNNNKSDNKICDNKSNTLNTDCSKCQFTYHNKTDHVNKQSISPCKSKSVSPTATTMGQNLACYSKTETGPALGYHNEACKPRKKPNLHIELPQNLPKIYPTIENNVKTPPSVRGSYGSPGWDSPSCRGMYPNSEQILETIEEVTPVPSAEQEAMNRKGYGSSFFGNLDSLAGKKSSSRKGENTKINGEGDKDDSMEDIRDMTLERLAQYLKDRSEELLADRSYLDSDVVNKIREQKVLNKPRNKLIKRKSASFRLPPSYTTHDLSFARPCYSPRRYNAASLDRIDELSDYAYPGENSLDLWIRKYGGGGSNKGDAGGIAGGQFKELSRNSVKTSSLGALDFKSMSNTGTGPPYSNKAQHSYDEMKYWTLQRRKKSTPCSSPKVSSPAPVTAGGGVKTQGSEVSQSYL